MVTTPTMTRVPDVAVGCPTTGLRTLVDPCTCRRWEAELGMNRGGTHLHGCGHAEGVGLVELAVRAPGPLMQYRRYVALVCGGSGSGCGVSGGV